MFPGFSGKHNIVLCESQDAGDLQPMTLSAAAACPCNISLASAVQGGEADSIADTGRCQKATGKSMHMILPRRQSDLVMDLGGKILWVAEKKSMKKLPG